MADDDGKVVNSAIFGRRPAEADKGPLKLYRIRDKDSGQEAIVQLTEYDAKRRGAEPVEEE